MRFSPVLLAVFTASAAFVSSPVEARSPSPTTAESAESSGKPETLESHPVSSYLAIGSPTRSQSVQAEPEDAAVEPPEMPSASGLPASGTMAPVVLPTLSAPELFSTEFAQAPVSQSPLQSAPAEAIPSPPGATQTPGQETPGRIEFNITPGSSTPEIQNNVPPESSPPLPPTLQPGTQQPQPTAEPEPRVLVAEVAVSGAEGALLDEVYSAIRTQPGRTTTRSQLQEDINAIFATGFFSNVRAVPEDTPLGVRVTFDVQPNPVLQTVQVEGSQVLPESVVNDIFAEQYGSILNLRRFQEGIEKLNQWYRDNGYALAQVTDAPQVGADGTVTLVVVEGVIEDIQVRFLNREGQAVDEQGNPIQGQTREFIITREFEAKPGDVFNQPQIQQDLQRVYGLGIFEDVQISLNPGQDPRKVDVVVNVTERNTGSIAAGLGFSSSSGLFGTASYQEQNLGGNNQRLGAEVQLGLRDFLFDVNFTDPWIAGDPYHTSYTVNGFNRRSISSIFDGGDPQVDLPNGDRPRINRFGGGVSFARPLDQWLGLEGWRGSAGLQYQRVSVRDSDQNLSPRDELGNDLSFSGTGRDDLLTVQIGASRDRRNDLVAPTSGSVIRFSTEQSIPVGTGSIFFNRLRGSYSYYIPVKFTNFNSGAQALAFNVQAGTVLGDLPPYEAFALGGTDSVRGYDFGELGSGRSFVQATVEYRFPIFAIVGGALFLDVGSDLGTGDNVPGNPAGIRDKPGTGFGYGLGVRIQSPLGQIRIDYGFNDQGDGRLHFGIGERF